MTLRTAIATLLDSAYDLRSLQITVETPNGDTTTGRITYDSGSVIVALLACKLVTVEESARKEELIQENRRVRAALIEEFNLKVK